MGIAGGWVGQGERGEGGQGGIVARWPAMRGIGAGSKVLRARGPCLLAGYSAAALIR